MPVAVVGRLFVVWVCWDLEGAIGKIIFDMLL